MATWVLLRGLLRDSRHWGSFTDAFKKAFPSDDVIALDLPGCGILNGQTSPASIAEMVECYRAQLGQQGKPAPYKILAVSMGAMVSAEWSLRYPQEIAAQVLINTSMRPFSPFYQRLRPSHVIPLLHLLLRRSSDRTWEEYIWRATCNTSHDSVVSDWAGYRHQFPVRIKNAIRQLLAAGWYRAPSHAPQAPTLILVSAQDRLVNAQCSITLVNRWNVPLAIHPTAGHDLPRDDEKWVLERVDEWMQSGFSPSVPRAHSRGH
jgi:pimeloyl-ACP methyl ester carboxylesterase